MVPTTTLSPSPERSIKSMLNLRQVTHILRMVSRRLKNCLFTAILLMRRMLGGLPCVISCRMVTKQRTQDKASFPAPL